MTRATMALALALALLALASPVSAQTGTNARVTGTIGGTSADGWSMQGTFACTGTPTCTGQYTISSRDGGCSNSYNLSGALVISGLNFAQSGAVQGLMVLDGVDYENDRRPDGTCAIRSDTVSPGSASYAGNWNLASGTGSFKLASRSDTVTGTFSADVAASVPVTDNTQLSGSFGGTGQDGSFQLTFSCRGSPSCAGQFSAEEAPAGCSNRLRVTGIYVMTGLNVAQSGSLKGMIGVENLGYETVRLADGTCTIRAGTEQEGGAAPYQGTWDATKGTGSFTVSTDGGSGQAMPGMVKADVIAPPPVFPIAVTSSITATSATATAAIQFRPQDVGTSGSIYTFAVAPANLVKGGFEPKAQQVGTAWSEKKADAPTCVVAQLNSSGQLIAVTTAQLQAYSSGSLSANGASVTILNNASTPTVAGATFYVGYGGSSSAMVTDGVYRPAVTVPGSSVCPMLSSQTALWWNPAENGWGVNFTHQGNILFATLFTYDANRVPLWLVMSNGAMQSDGATFTGELYRTTGPAFNANPFTPIGPANYTRVGTMTASFVDVNSGTLKYTVNGVEVNKGIQRLVYGTRAASCLPSATASRASSTNYQDLWWNAAEGGWGVNVTHQDNTLFATLFTYDASGRDLWLVMSGGVRQGDGSYQGTLYRASGPPFNANPFTPITEANMTTVGTMRFQFADGEHGTLSYTVDGAPVTKAITRLVISSPVPVCN